MIIFLDVMGRRTDEVALKRLRRSYINGDGNLKELSSIHGIPYQTARRYAKNEQWASERLTLSITGNDVKRAIAERLKNATDDVDQVKILSETIARLTKEIEQMGLTHFKSKEGAITALVRLLDAYRDRRPETIEEIVARCVELNIKPQDFLRKLDEAYR